MRNLAIGLAVTAGMLVGGCAEGTDDEVEIDGTVPTTEPSVPAPTESAEERPSVDQLGVDSLAGAGAYLTDRSGRALYLLEGEPEGESTCYDACAEEWPPFTMDGAAGTGDSAARPEAGVEGGAVMAGAQDIEPGSLGTIQRTDDSTQLTYDGHALYYYHDDQGPGQTQGHDVTDAWGEWYLVTPDGQALEDPDSGS